MHRCITYMKLKPRERISIKEYIKTKHGTKSAIKAGYSKRSARTTAAELLAKPNISELVEKGLKNLEEKIELSAEKVLRELTLIAFANVTKCFDEKGRLRPLHELSENQQKILSSVETEEEFLRYSGKKVKCGYVRKIKTYDKVRALEMLAKHFKLLTEIQEINNNDVQVILTLPANGSEKKEDNKE